MSRGEPLHHRWVEGSETVSDRLTDDEVRQMVEFCEIVGGVQNKAEVPTVWLMKTASELLDLRAEVARLREVISRTTTLRDWLAGGYTIDEYRAFNAESEGE